MFIERNVSLQPLNSFGIAARAALLTRVRGGADVRALLADAELAPGQHLEDLFHGAEAAGQGDEAIGQIEHARLALMHRTDDLQVGQAAMGHTAAQQGNTVLDGHGSSHLSLLGLV